MSKNTATKKAGTRKDLTKTQWILKEVVRNKVAYFMVAPYMILFAMFTVMPVVLSIVVSFTDFNLLEWPNFVFLDNYVSLFFDDDIFLIAIKNTLIFAVVVGPVSYLMSFLVAWFINELPPRIRALVTLVFYAPSLSGNVYIVWQTLFSGDSYGWVNGWLMQLGFIAEPIQFFQNGEDPVGVLVGVTDENIRFFTFVGGKCTSLHTHSSVN